MSSLVFQVFSKDHEKAQLGESPVWDPDMNELWWVDVTGRQLLKTDLQSGETRVWGMPEYIGFVVLTASNAPAVGLQTGIFTFVPATGVFEKLVHFDEVGRRFNDATVDQNGRLLASTMALDAEAGQAAIHLVNADMGLDTLVDRLSIPNGLAVDTDRNRLFYSDSHPDIQKIWVRPIDGNTGLPGSATLFSSTAELDGRPDGAALDHDGNYWVAGVDGSQLLVFDLSGELHATVPVPFPAPTKICFCGHDNRTIVVTSKDFGKNGGYLAKAELSSQSTAGVGQPYWKPGT